MQLLLKAGALPPNTPRALTKSFAASGMLTDRAASERPPIISGPGRATVQACGPTSTPLLQAVYAGRLETAKELVRLGADPLMRMGSLTPMYVAMQWGYWPLVEWLLSLGAKVHDLGGWAYHEYNQPTTHISSAIIITLIAFLACLHTHPKSDATPIHGAAMASQRVSHEHSNRYLTRHTHQQRTVQVR